MKEIKLIDSVYLKDFDVKVNPYLTYAQIQNIVNAVCKFDTWAERQQNIDILLLHYATDITDNKIEEYGHDQFIQSGIIDEIKTNIKNLNQVYEAIEYTQSTQRALAQILKELPKIVGPFRKGEENDKSSKKQPRT